MGANHDCCVICVQPLAQELQELFMQRSEEELASQVPGLRVLDRCRCGDDFCGTFYVRAKLKPFKPSSFWGIDL
jgi:hypothetical protein